MPQATLPTTLLSLSFFSASPYAYALFFCVAGSDMLRDLIENLKSLDRSDARFAPLVQQITANFGTFSFSHFQFLHHIFCHPHSSMTSVLRA